MTNPNTPKQAQPAVAEMRTRRASEVFRILEPSPMKPIAAVPIGLWNTGWLPKPQGASS